MRKILVLIILVICNTQVYGKVKKSLSIKDFKTTLCEFNASNYFTLKEFHEQAIALGFDLDYSGLDTVKLEIPANAAPIPIPNSINFQNVVFLVKNKNKDFYLFKFCNDLTPIEICKECLKKNKGLNLPEFKNKKILLVATDENPWVKERKGYNATQVRKDIFIIDDCKRLNDPIKPIDSEYSTPSFSYCDVTNGFIYIENLKFIRTKDSSYKTFCLSVENSNDVKINNIHIETPASELYGDAILRFLNCTNLTLKNISINGTYSQKDKYGYGFSMNNIYNCKMENLYGNGNWGVFGTNNVNNVDIEDSDLNRFDIHCYGKDVYCANTTFRNLYNQFSSFFGKLTYSHCKFVNFVPVTIDGSYSAYTSFDVIFEECDITLDSKRPFLFNMTTSKFMIDTIRPELTNLEWPNVTMKDTNITCPIPNKTIYLFHTYKNEEIVLDKRFKLDLQDVNFNNLEFRLSNSILKYNVL